MNRWVNKGTHGIALIDDTRARPGLKYVFDLRDTHMGYNGRTPYLWTLRPEHEARLQEHLTETYDLENIYPNSLPETLLETARAAVRENLSEYMEYFREAAQDSFLEEFDDLNQTVRMRETMAASVAYLLLKRCGYQPDEYLDPESLQFITDFNTFPVICHLGDAVNNTAKPVLMDIGREIRSMERESFLQNSLASEQRTIYNKSSERFSTLIRESNNMGGASYEREQETDIHANRRLSDPQPDDGRTAGGNSRQIRDAAENVSEGTQGRDVSISSSERQADRASSGDRSDSQPTSGTDREPDAADEPGTGQSNRSDSMGSAHDSPEPDSRGDGSERSDLRLEPDTPESSENVSQPEAEDVTSSAFSLPIFPTETEQIEEIGRQEAPAMLSDRIPLSILDEVLTGGGNRDKSQLRIAALFMSDMPEQKRSVLLAKEYDTTDIGLQIDGEKYAVYCDPHGIQIAYGDMVDGATDKAFVSWETAVSRIETLLDEGRFLPQVVLDNALDNECEELAESLLFAYRDYNFDQYDFPYFDFKELYHGTFPDAKEELARRLHSPENIQEHIRVLKQLHEDCLENPDRMRFQMYIARMPDILDRLERLSTARQHYRTAEDFIPHSRSLFLTQDAIDSYFINRHMDSRLGTYSAYLQMDKKQLADYIKNSYGIAGGQSHALRGSDKTWMDYSSKGIKFTMGDLSSPTDTVFLSWSKVADRIQRLIRDGKYIHDDDRAHMRDFEREKLAREIVSFVSSTPLELREDIPFPLVENLIADYSEQVRELTLLLEDESQAESIASYMQITLDQLPEDTRNMDSLKQHTEHVMSYAAGTYSLFPEAEKTDAKLQEPSRNIPTELTKEPVIRTVASGEQLSLFDFMTPDTEPEAKVEQEPQKAEKTRPKPYDTFLSSEAQNEYNALKEKYPDHLIGFEQKRPDIGFFEFYGEDARIVTDILGTRLKNKDLEDGINVAMAEIPAEDWSDAVQKLWRQGNNIYLAALGDHGTHYKAKELLAEDFIPLGLELKIEGHDFRVDNVNFRTNEVTMMDLTFMNQFRYPLSRVEPIDFVYNYINEQASISERLTSLDPAPEPVDSAVTSVKEIPSSDLTAEPVSESEAVVPEPAKPHTAENYKIIDDHLGEGGPKAKFQRNIAAIKLLQELEFDDRMATSDEQEVLAQYVGWGGLPMAFDEHNVTWAKEHKQLKELLSPPEYEAARESVLNAHYTSPTVIRAVYEAIGNMRYLQHDLLDEMGLQHFDNWAAQFGETTTAIELAPEGTGYRAKTRFSRFFNLPELMSAWKECADIQTVDMLNLPTPEALYENVIVPPSNEQKEMVASLADRAESIHAGAVDPSVDNMLKVTNDGRKIALDQRLANPLLPDHPGSKVNACVGRTFQIWTDTAEQKLTQVIFCDLSTPSGKGKSEFNVYDDIKAKLIARGVPAEEIAFIHDANTEVQKATLFSKVRSGQVRVILGSTSKMGAGTNIQDKLVALHHLDTPWRPSDVEQQEGRILRQGNTNKQVHIFRYLTEQTFDSYMWQILENKQKFIGQVMTSKSPSRSCEDTDEVSLKYAEVKALASGNPLILEKTQLDTDVTKLKLMKANHVSQHYALEDRLLKSFPKQIQTTQELIAGLQKDLQTVKQNLPPDADHFQMTVAGRLYTNRKEAGAALIDSCSNLQPASTGGKIGNYAGFTLQAQFDSFSRQFYLVVKGHTSHSIELGDDPGGNITRLNNLLNSFEKRLEEQTQKLSSLHSQVEEAKAELERPFPHEEELNEKQARLNEVNALLDIDNRGSNTASKGERASVIPLSSGQQKTAYADALPKRPSVLEKLHRYKDAVSSDHLTKHLSKQQSL